MSASFDVGGVQYERNAALNLRRALIGLRDDALSRGDMDGTVRLTHAVGLLTAMIDHIWPEPPQ